MISHGSKQQSERNFKTLWIEWKWKHNITKYVKWEKFKNTIAIQKLTKPKTGSEINISDKPVRKVFKTENKNYQYQNKKKEHHKRSYKYLSNKVK